MKMQNTFTFLIKMCIYLLYSFQNKMEIKFTDFHRKISTLALMWSKRNIRTESYNHKEQRTFFFHFLIYSFVSVEGAPFEYKEELEKVRLNILVVVLMGLSSSVMAIWLIGDTDLVQR